MDTGAHIVCNLVIQSRPSQSRVFALIILGAVLPDLPMILFYAWESLVMGTKESAIWSELYFLPGWQNFFDVFNSLPFILIVLAIGLISKKNLLSVLALSMILHILLDLPLHNDDAHRHFFPLSDWRFVSPVSYWDPMHYGKIMSFIQIAIVALGLVILWFRHSGSGEKAVLVLMGIGYGVFQIFVTMIWSG